MVSEENINRYGYLTHTNLYMSLHTILELNDDMANKIYVFKVLITKIPFDLE